MVDRMSLPPRIDADTLVSLSILSSLVVVGFIKANGALEALFKDGRGEEESQHSNANIF